MEPVIPLVKEEVCFSIENQMMDESYLGDMAKHIAKHNPTVAGFIHLFVSRLPTCCKHAAMLASLTTYRLIESQMESDRMNSNLKL